MNHIYQRLPSVAMLLVGAVAALVSGCSTTRPSEDSFLDTERATALVEKLDEALIGMEGPDQVEDAIETLDARTENQPALVRLLGANPPSLPDHDDLFERIRSGFALQDVDHPSIDAEQDWFVRHPAYLDRTFKRGERYLHHIVSEIEARKMPLELALLPVVESAFNPVAYSRARASGLWQFIPATGRRYGLKQNWFYDGRRDVLAATTAALDYLEFLAAEFNGDWMLAVAAYNTGEANVARAIKRNQEAGLPTDFFSLRLPKETRAYVPKLLAMRRIVANPAAFGLEFAPIPNQPYFQKVEIPGQIDLNVAAELAGIAKEDLLALNPAFNHWVTDPDGPHYLLIPTANAERFAQAVVAMPPEQRVRVAYHRVRKGDTLGAIAAKYGVTVASLRSVNKLRGSIIHPGQELLISAPPRGGEVRLAQTHEPVARPPVAKSSPSGRYVVRRGDTLWNIARQHGLTADHLAAANGLSRDGTLAVGQVLSIPRSTRLASNDARAVNQAVTYVVRSGDTLSRIAAQFRVRLNDLMGWNNLTPRSIIKPGQRLVMYVDGRRGDI